MGAAVQSHAFAVGAIVPWAKSGVGLVATQALVNVDNGPRGIAMLADGVSPEAVIDRLTAADPSAAVRQFAVLDAGGRAAAHTGGRCIAEAGHAVDTNVSVQANMMDRPGVPERMLAAWHASRGSLEQRLLAALRAAQEGGGDIRGMQSAALLIVPVEGVADDGYDRLVDVRVDDHPQPLQELERLLRFSHAYHLADEAEQASITAGADSDRRAAGGFAAAAERAPELGELRFWEAIALAAADAGRSRRLIADLDAVDGERRWYRLALRLPPTGMFSHPVGAWDRLLSPEPGLLYHIHSATEDKLPPEIVTPSLRDDGFVHCCYAHQLRRVQQRHFPEQVDPFILELDPAAIEAEIRLEDLYELDEEFPHIYGPLPKSAVRRSGPASAILPGL